MEVVGVVFYNLTPLHKVDILGKRALQEVSVPFRVCHEQALEALLHHPRINR